MVKQGLMAALLVKMSLKIFILDVFFKNFSLGLENFLFFSEKELQIDSIISFQVVFSVTTNRGNSKQSMK